MDGVGEVVDGVGKVIDEVELVDDDGGGVTDNVGFKIGELGTVEIISKWLESP